MAVSALYDATTGPTIRVNREFMAWHVGLWGPDTTSDAQAPSRALTTQVHGCNPGPGQRVLDAGREVGGSAITLAERFVSGTKPGGSPS